jgi:5-dehydro-2-deoxygluconokinase
MLRVTEEDLAYIAGRDMFITNGTSLCASPSRESTYLALERGKRAGRRVLFDVDYRAMSWASAAEAGQAVRLALPFIDVLIGNQPELRLVAGEDDLERATESLRERIPMLVSKLGEQGTRVWQGRDSVFLPPYAVEVVSTIGAGDGFASGFIYALLAGKSVTECLHFGNAAAAIVVSRLSCSEAMPKLAEVEALIRSQQQAVHG